VSNCTHFNVKVRTAPFFGAVSKDQNPLAHGNVCEKETCTKCGKIRLTNINGLHLEVGEWHVDERAEALANARKALGLARNRMAEVSESMPVIKMNQCSVYIASDGYIQVSSGDGDVDVEAAVREAIAQWQRSWDQLVAARRALVDAEAALAREVK
jgi:hypothetical protein